MAGAGLRLSKLFAGEGERGLLLYDGNSPERIAAPQLSWTPWVPMHRSRNYLRRNGAKDNRKIPWSVLPFGPFAEAFDPPRMLTQCVHGCQRTLGWVALRWSPAECLVELQHNQKIGRELPRALRGW